MDLLKDLAGALAIVLFLAGFSAVATGLAERDVGTVYVAEAGQ